MRRDDSTADKAPGMSAGSWVLGLVAGLLIYVLSIGPVVYLTEVLDPPDAVMDVVQVLYKPVSWVREDSPLYLPMLRYMAWWLELAK